MAHVAPASPGEDGRTVIVITLSGGDVAAREALGERVAIAAREALNPQPARNGLATVFSRLSQPRGAPRASPYEAPFLLGPLRRPRT